VRCENPPIKVFRTGAIQFNFDNGKSAKCLFNNGTVVVINYVSDDGERFSKRFGADAFADYIFELSGGTK